MLNLNLNRKTTYFMPLKQLASLLTAPLVLGVIAGSPATALPDCSAWNSPSFFEEASVDDVAHCLDAGADPNARDEDGWTAWDLIPDDSPLRDSDVYWQLNDARF